VINLIRTKAPLNYNLKQYLPVLRELVDSLEIMNLLTDARMIRSNYINGSLFQYDFFSILFDNNTFSVNLFFNNIEKKNKSIRNYHSISGEKEEIGKLVCFNADPISYNVEIVSIKYILFEKVILYLKGLI